MRTAVTIAVLALLAACGGSSEKVTIDATPAGLRKAAEATLTKGTAKLDLTVDVAVLGQNIMLRGTGAADPAHKRFQVDFDAKDLFTKILGARGTPTSEQLAALDKPLTEVVDGSVLYMHLPAIASTSRSGGKEWLKIDLASVNHALGDALGSGGGAIGSDPSSFLQFLEGAGKVTKVGDEDVRGTKTAHFSGSYSLRDALSRLPADRRDKVEKAFQGLGLSSSAEDQQIPFDAWVDGDGLVRRLQTTIDPSTFATKTSTPGGRFSVTEELYDFGAPVDIKVPTDDQVLDVSSTVSTLPATASSTSN